MISSTKSSSSSTLVFVVLVIGFSSIIRNVTAWVLPDGFTMIFDPTSGWELRWKSLQGIRVEVGSSRPEFRWGDDDGVATLSSSKLFGYPIETNDGGLRLVITGSQQQQLSDEGGANLQVWKSGRRLDKVTKQDVIPANSITRSYDSKAPNTPIVDINPSAKGNYTTGRLWYNLSAFQYSEFPVPIEIVAEVTRPILATGKRPLVLFLHGRHSTCYDSSGIYGTSDWPCLDGYKPIPSYKGYRYVADILASQGYITVSISANGINGQDGSAQDFGTSARSILIRRHLSLWSKWNRGTVKDPWGGIFKGKVNLSKVVLVGHSRGGEGVNRAAVDTSSTSPFTIVGIVSYGPTAFGRQVTPDIHSATILPTCDGDVSDLQGQAYIDDSRDIAYSTALRAAVVAIGTNHNYYNTEWTPGLSVAPSNDDWSDSFDPVCGDQISGSLRLSPQEQQAVGAAYTCALVRFAVNNDQQMLQFLDGSFVKPKSIGRAEVAVHAIGGASYNLLYRPQYDNETTTIVNLRNGMKGNVCKGYSSFISASDTPQCANNDYFSSPHWLSMSGVDTRPAPRALELQWNNRYNTTATFTITATNLSNLSSIDIRIANDPNQKPAQLELWIRDRSGNNSTLTTSLTAIDGWPGMGSLDRVHAHTFRGYISSANARVNLNSIVAIILVTRTYTGRIWVLDVAASKTVVSKPPNLDLPVLSVAANVTVPEGFGPRLGNLPIVADRRLTAPASVWVQTSYGEGYKLDIPVGTRIINIPFNWIGDNIYGTSNIYNSVTLATLSGAIAGNYMGSLSVVEDDPAPSLSVVKSTVSALEGSNLQWTFRLSGATTGMSYYLTFVPPLSGTELNTDDVDRAWLQQITSPIPSPPVPLSSLSVSVNVQFRYGETESTLIIPLVYDLIPEGNETVRLELMAFDNPTVTNRIVINGIARDYVQ